MGRVADLGCILCWFLEWGKTPAQVHHVFDRAAKSDYLTIPLCEPHHTGPNGFHGLGEREFNRRYKTSEAELLALTIQELA